MSYKGASRRRSITGRVFRKHALHMIIEEHKQEVRMAFELFDLRKIRELNYRNLKNVIYDFVRCDHHLPLVKHEASTPIILTNVGSLCFAIDMANNGELF
ncbi:hypothetical protein M758_UG108900 [Ceratodon purpureus]|nr:hypothetical protein M758_UG108900 [Ceratodon purpureus]